MVRRRKAGERLRDVAEAINLRTTTVRRWWRRHWGWSSLRIARDLPVRAALYMAATACMRKLLTILNAMVHQQRRWDPELG